MLTDLATGREVFTLDPCQFNDGWLKVAFSADGTTLAVRTTLPARGKDQWENVVRVLDVDSGLTKQQFKIDRADHYSLALSAEGKRVALSWIRNNSTRENAIWVWEVAGGKSLCRFGREGWADELAFSPDGSLLAGAGGLQPLRVCAAATGADWVALDEAIGQVQSNLAFSADGRLLAAAIARDWGTAPVVRVWELASGQVRSEFKGHEEGIRAVAFAPDGLTLATGSGDTTVLVWDVSGRAGAGGDRLTPQERDALWSDLGGEARKAHRALARLADAPADAVALVRERLPPAASKTPELRQIERWIAELDAEAYEAREEATRALRKAGPAARMALHKALEAKPSLEQKLRLEALLADLNRTRPSPQMLRPTRALELLERIGTPEARRLLDSLAQGSPEAPLTQQARAARDRLAGKVSPVPRGRNAGVRPSGGGTSWRRLRTRVLRQEHRCPPDAARPQPLQGLIGLGQGEGLDRGADRHQGGQRQERLAVVSR
jgi:WD40 repeat protein